MFATKQTAKPLVSVIVPVYNTKEYLDRCLESLRNQTLHNIEIVLIDDGSYDGSELICDLYSKNDSRFIVFHKDNGGLAAARNDGLNLAHASYIMFVDSDDWVEPEFCELTYHIAETNNADVVVFQYYQHGRLFTSKRRLFPSGGISSSEDVLTKYWSFTGAVVWNKLYRRYLFKGIQFPFGHLCEDGAVTHLVIYKAKRVFLSNEHLYHHLNYRNDSISNNMKHQFYGDAFHYGFERLGDLKSWGYDYTDEEMKLALLYLLICGRDSELSDKNERVLLQNTTYPQNASLKQKIMFRLFRLSPELFDVIAKASKMRLKERR